MTFISQKKNKNKHSQQGNLRVLNFKMFYKNVKEFKLEQNYRSTQNIVNAANSLIANNKNKIEKTIFSEKESGSKIKTLKYANDREEGNQTSDIIAKNITENKTKASDYAILYRTNSQSKVLEDGLRKRGVNYKIFGGLSFYQRKEIKDVMAYLKLIINNDDDESLIRIINYPTRGIGLTTIDRIRRKSENQSQIIGGRKISEILNRFNNKIKDPRKFAEGKKTASIIREYLKISCPMNTASKKLNNFFSKHKIKIDLKDEFFPLKDKLGKNKIIFSTNFGRELEYYTGMVFNIKGQSSTNLIQGGRYDNLLSNLGSNRKIPAVGAAINLNSYDN